MNDMKQGSIRKSSRHALTSTAHNKRTSDHLMAGPAHASAFALQEEYSADLRTDGR